MPHVLTGGGVAASHEIDASHLVRTVASATENEINNIIAPLVPVACWRVNDLRFDFNSSVVRRDMKEEVQALRTVREAHKMKVGANVALPRLSIFGHADPVGDDEFNKQLSGRRAKAVYALFTRRIDMWDQLFNQPLPGDDWRTSDELKSFARERNLTDRHALFAAYMDDICGPDFKLDATKDFLAAGTDPQGKGDFQGCSEFNPVRLLSSVREKGDTETRNRDNAPNRRVVVYMFRPDNKVTATKWPCPRANEPSAGCRKRFWSDGERRRKPGEAQREYVISKDTFACRFYDRFATVSPCEGVTSVFADWVPEPVEPVDADTSTSLEPITPLGDR